MGVLDRFRLDGKVAVVTGGAGLFGRQVVEAVAEAGAHAVIASRTLDAIEAQAAGLRERGLKATAMRLDQADESSVLALRDRVRDEVGPADVLVNNAVSRPMKGWGDSASAFAESMQTNATGIFLMCRAFGDAMAERGGGSIVNVASIQGTVGPDFTLYDGLGLDIPPDYFVHKGGMIQLTRYVASKLGPRGVRANVVCPGGFFNNQPPEFVERYAARTMVGRMANDHDLQGAIVFLASDASAYVTAAVLAVDGGYTAK